MAEHDDVGDRIDPTWERVEPVWASSHLSGAQKSRLEAAFSAPAPTRPGDSMWIAPGQKVWGSGGPAGLAYVVQGSIREVVEHDQEAWPPRGRDPRVVDVLGAGCLLGLEYVRGELGLGDGVAGSERGRRTYVVNPGRRVGVRGGKLDADGSGRFEWPLVARYLPMDAVWTLAEDPDIRAWLERRCAAIDQRGPLQEIALQNPLLAALGRPAVNLLLQSASLHKPGVSAAPFRAAGSACEDVHLLIRGQAEMSVPAEGTLPADVVSLIDVGDLIDAQCLVGEVDRGLAGSAEGSPVRRVNVRVSADAELLTWPRELVRKVFRQNPAAWHRLVAFATPTVVESMSELARVTCVAADRPGWGAATDPAVLSLGTALTLASAAHQTQRVVLIDLAGGAAMAGALGVDLVLGDIDPGRDLFADVGIPEAELPTFRGLELPAGHPVATDPWASLRIVVPTDVHDLVDLVDLIRANDSVVDVVVHIPADDAPLPMELIVARSAPGGSLPPWYMTSLAVLVLDALRIMPYTVLWLSVDPDGWYRLTDEAPDRLIRVDRLTEDFVAAARARVPAFFEHDDHGLVDDRPGTRADARMVVPAAEEGFATATAGGLLSQLEHAQADRGGQRRDQVGDACWRAFRMITRQTVGVALGGGGTWGASHIAVLEALAGAGVPVDYVSGTSFGALIGGVYAGGGMPALRYFLQKCEFEAGPGAWWLPKPVRKAIRKALPGVVTFLRDEGRAMQNPVAGGMRRAMLGEAAELDKMVLDMVYGAPGTWATSAPSVPGAPQPCLLEAHVPFLAVASNLSEHTEYAPYHFPLGMAVRGASGLPPGFPGLWFKGEKFVDGAALANVPCEALRRSGADFVVSINVVGAGKVPVLSSEPAGQWRPHVGTWAERVGDTIKTGWLTLWNAGTSEALQYADVLVDIRITGVPLSSTWRAPDIVAGLAGPIRDGRVAERIAHLWRNPGPDERDTLRIPLAFDGDRVSR